MILALAVHLKGFGLALRSVIKFDGSLEFGYVLNTPRQIYGQVISANNHLNRLIQYEDVGVKCSLKRGCLAIQACTLGLVSLVVVSDACTSRCLTRLS